MDTSDLGTRMKEYESVNQYNLLRRMPFIIRLDGKSFHTFTKKIKFQKPFDENMMKAMIMAATKLIEEIQGSKLAYVQSDEISIMAIDYENINTQAWFDKNLQKMVSVSASIASIYFNDYLKKMSLSIDEYGLFDSRSFVLPKEEVCNYFIWRQSDSVRNSIQGLGQAYFSHKQLHKLNCNQIQEKLFQENQINWDKIEIWKKRGICLYKRQVEKEQYGTKIFRTEIVEDWEIPIFTQDRNYIEKWI